MALFYLGRKYEKRTLLLVGGSCLLASNLLLYLANGFALAAAYQALLGVGNGIFNGIVFAALPDLADYTEWKTGVAMPGMISAFATFSMKIGGAVAALFVSQALVWARYDAARLAQSESTRTILRISFPVSSIICLTAATLLAATLKNLQKDCLARYREEINARQTKTLKEIYNV
jgi:Na+/melibiose symporter-like transporter